MQSLLKRRLKSALGRVAGMAGLYNRDFRSKLTIMAFHRVNPQLPDDGITCSPVKFEAFCDFFQEHFRVVPLAVQIEACRAGAAMGGTLSITFDDGYLDSFEVAAPILRRRAMPATFFVTTGFIGSTVVPPWDYALKQQPGWMSWNHLRKLAAQGFAVANHTETHLDMGSASVDDVRRDLQTAKRKLREEVGVEKQLFAYPFGGPENLSARSLGLVREEEFLCCVSCFGGSNAPVTDPYQLRRIAVAEWFWSPHQFGLEMLSGAA